MCAFKNHYTKWTVTGPITSWYSRSTQSTAGIKIVVIGMSTSEDTDWTQVHVTAPPKGFWERKVYHNFILILYNFVHQVPNFVHPSFFHYPQFKFGGGRHSAPSQMQFQHKKLDHNFVQLCTPSPKFVHPSFFRYPQFKFGVGDMQPPPPKPLPPNAVST